MSENLFDPVVLCFLAGLLAGVMKSDLRFPEALYETLSIYLLLTIGLKGGVELAQSEWLELISPALGTVFLGIFIPIVAYFILTLVGRFDRADAAALAAHYGSVSAVTFAVVLAYLQGMRIEYEEYVTVLLVLMEIPAIAVGITIARLDSRTGPVRWGPLLHEVFLGKSIYLLFAGLVVGCVAGPERMKTVTPFFFDLFKGVLALFLLEMGLLASRRMRELKKVGVFLLGFGVMMPLLSGGMGVMAGLFTGLSVGGMTVLATLAASSSYIAAPAAVRIAIPKANPTLYLTASLGITFPFNLVLGIPIYYWMARTAASFGANP